MKLAKSFACASFVIAGAFPIISFAEEFDPFSTQKEQFQYVGKDFIPYVSERTPCQIQKSNSPLSLLDVIQRALCHNPQTRQAWANVRAQAAQVGVSQASYLPSINASLALTKQQSNTRLTALPGINFDARTSSPSGNLSLSWVLFDFGLRSANVENAEQLMAAASAAQNVAFQSVFISAAQAYYDLLTARAVLKARKEAEAVAKESFFAADAKYKAGLGTLADKLQAQTSFTQTKLNSFKADGDLKIAQGTLANVMGLNASAEIAVGPEDSPLPNTTFLHSVDTLIEDAVEKHPSLIAATAQLKAAQANVKAATAEGLPTLSLTSNISRTSQGGQFPGEEITNSKTVGIQVTIPLLEGFGRIYRVKAAQAQAEAKQADLDNTHLQVSLNVWKSYHSLLTETENLKAVDDLLQSADQSFKVAHGRYKAGVGNILELLSAQSTLANAKQQQIQAMSNWRLSRLKLASSLGKLGFWALH